MSSGILRDMKELGPGVVQATLPDFWPDYETRLTSVLADFYEAPNPLGFYPHFNEAALRSAVLAIAPPLDEIKGELEARANGDASAIIVDSLHLARWPEPARRRLLLAFCLTMGFPTPSDQRRGTLLWDVRVRGPLSGRAPTYSEHGQEADLHSDSQIYPAPEPVFILYTLAPARCGGGVSLFAAASAIEAALAETPAGREAARALAELSFPFSLETGAAGPKRTSSVTVAPILGANPKIRYRRDAIEAGFEARRDLDVPAARAALRELERCLRERVPVVRHALREDSIAICDNYRLLHGRTNFEDQGRHLIRARMSPIPVAMAMSFMMSKSPAFASALGGS